VPIVIHAKVVTKTVTVTEPKTAIDTTEITVTIKSTIGIDNKVVKSPSVPQEVAKKDSWSVPVGGKKKEKVT
jgi:hypothetical protein